MLRQIEVGIANGKTTPQACKEAAITVQTFYRWRKEYGGQKMDQAKRLKELEKENGKFRVPGSSQSRSRQPIDTWLRKNATAARNQLERWRGKGQRLMKS